MVPGDALPRVRAWRPILRVHQALLAVDVVHQPRPFRAQRTAADRVVRVAFDMEDARFGVFRAVAEAVHEDAAAYRTVGAVVACLFGTQQLVLA
ncbi:hypothetical protein D3C81_1471590 [compost metagenome]